MKRSFLFLLFVFSFLVFPLVAQEEGFTITEAELTRLERISESWEMNRRNQQLQIQSLKAKLNEALTKSEALKSQLQTERETLKNLRQSYAEYENGVNMELELKTIQIEKLKKQGYRLKLALVIVSCILGLLILGSTVFFILKMKLKLL
nr:MAG TPA: SECRETED 45 KDA PROTEIN CYCLE, PEPTIDOGLYCAN, CHAP, CELL [Caudoviricetes sp.]